MKRITATQRKRMIVLSRRRFRRAQYSKTKAALVRGARVERRSLRRAHRPESRYATVVAPKFFTIVGKTWRRPMVVFLRRIGNFARNGKRVRVDFCKTVQMFPSGTILFRAELDRLSSVFGPRVVRAFRYPDDPVVEQVLQQVGIARALGLGGRVPTHQLAESVKHWRCATGAQTDGQSVAPLLSMYQGRITPRLGKSLYGGVVEAMANSLAHAYIRPRGDGIDAADMGRRWWMFSHEADGLLTVTFCDLGIGIPRSLATSGRWSASLIETIVNSFGLKPKTAARIKAAIELGRTRTGQRHRGKGLDDVLDVVKDATRGGLRIHSDRGEYNFDAATKFETLRDYDEDIMATIVEWTIPVSDLPNE